MDDSPRRPLRFAAVIVGLVGLAAVGLYLLILNSEDDHAGLTVDALPGPSSDPLLLDPAEVQRDVPELWQAIMDADRIGYGRITGGDVEGVLAFLEDKSSSSGRDWHQLSLDGRGYAIGIESL